jgi:hypothetical protein
MTRSTAQSMANKGWVALVTLLLASFPAFASFPALAQTFVDGASNCSPGTGARNCPFRQIGEGQKRVSPGGTLFIKGGSYVEPILLNKVMQIQAFDGPATIVGSPLAPFDLVANADTTAHLDHFRNIYSGSWFSTRRVDDNGLPLNPKWGGQLTPGGVPPDPRLCPPGRGIKDDNDPGSSSCSHQFTYLNDAHLCGPHINWFPATYSGTIFWDEHSCPFVSSHPDDNDYTVNVTRDDQAGFSATRSEIHCEFDSNETIDHFDSPWWNQFHGIVDQEGCGSKTPGPSGMIDGTFTIMTGLMNFDVEHTIHVELHPVWALAMNVQPFPMDDDLWTFFVRNWGNEGFCSSDQEFVDFPNNQYTFRLPWRAGATSVTVLSTTSFHAYHTQNPPPSEQNGSIRKVPGVGIFVTFALDAPREDGSMWDGELHLQWTGQ